MSAGPYLVGRRARPAAHEGTYPLWRRGQGRCRAVAGRIASSVVRRCAVCSLLLTMGRSPWLSLLPSFLG